eukprot:14700486-Ditylum_brightwellii.AAC.1
MEPEAAGSCLDITIGADLTALKRMAEEFTVLQYHARSMRIMAYHHIGKHVVCGMDGIRKIGALIKGRTAAVIQLCPGPTSQPPHPGPTY